MRPDYSLLPRLEADTTDAGRTYRVVGRPEIPPMRSITTALSLTADKSGLEDWRKRVGEEEAKRISRAATERGSRVHAFMEAALVGDDLGLGAAIADLALANDGGLAMAKALSAEARKHVSEVWAQEIALYSPTLHVAGRTDLIGLWDGELAVCDWKTSRKPKAREWTQDYALQCTAYARMHRELTGVEIDRLVIAITCETGDVQVFVESARQWNWLLEQRLQLLPPLTP